MSSLKFLNMCQLKKGVGMSYISTPSSTLSLYTCLSLHVQMFTGDAYHHYCTNILDERTDYSARGDRDGCTGKPGAIDLCGLMRCADCTDSAFLGRTAQCTDSASLGMTAHSCTGSASTGTVKG